MTTDSLGHGAVNLSGTNAKFGSILTATATDLATMDTSEFSTAVTVGVGAPRVVDTTLVLTGGNVSSVVLTFLGGLSAKTATKIANYTLTGLGADGNFGTADDVAVTIASAKYNAKQSTVTLTPKIAPTASQFVRVFASGDGITSPAGTKLDGE